MSVLLSIVIPVRNNLTGLRVSLDSVIGQQGDWECLVMDGASEDGSKDFLASLNNPRIRYISDHDDGVYDAMNKGIDQTNGSFVYFLGGGDTLLPGALSKVAPFLLEGTANFVYGDAILEGRVYDGEFTALKLCSHNICHQAIFYHRSLFKHFGAFETKYRALADWAFNLRCFGSRFLRPKYVPVVVANFEEGGMSGRGDTAFDRDKACLILCRVGLISFIEFYLPHWKATLSNCARSNCFHVRSYLRRGRGETRQVPRREPDSKPSSR